MPQNSQTSPSLTIVRIDHPDELRTKENRYAVASYTHRRRGRRPRHIPIERKLAVPWPKSTTPAPSENGTSVSGTNVESGQEGALTSRKKAIFKEYIAPRSPSPMTIEFDGIRRDPFKTYPIPVEGCVESAVDFWLSYWVPSQITEFLHQKNAVVSAVIDTMFCLSMESTEAFQSMVAMSQAIREAMFHHDANMTPSKQVLYHKGKVLEALQSKILSAENAIDEATMLTVLNLMALDLFYHDAEPFGVHLSAFRRMMAQYTAFNSEMRRKIFEGYIDVSIVFYRALVYQSQRPSLMLRPKKLDWCSAPIELSFQLPPGFQALAQMHAISPTIMEVISRMSSWINIINDAGKRKDLGSIQGIHPWLDMESALTCLELDTSEDSPSTEHVVSLSLFCLGMDISRRFRLNGTFFRMLTELIDSVRQYPPQNEAQKHLRLWATLVAAASSADGTPLDYQGRVLVDFVIQEEQAFISWASMEEIVRSFFWFRFAHGTWRTCWLAGLERQQRLLKS